MKGGEGMELCQVPDKEREADISLLVERHGNTLLRFCYLYLNDLQLAEDAVQETYLKAHLNWHTFRGESSEQTWLTAIALNCCRSLTRSAWFRRENRAVELDKLPEASVDFDPADDTVIREVMLLPRKYREVILLHYYQGLKLREIAAMMSLPEATLSTRLKRARAKLKEKLERWYFDEKEF